MIRRMMLPTALAVLLFVSACGKPQSSRPAAKTGIEGAFAVAFPSGATEKDSNGNAMTFTAQKLVPVSADGSIQALISNGSLGDGAAHADTGDLRITYLNSKDGTFSQLKPPIQESLGGDGFGEPPDWRVIQRHHQPALIVTFNYTNQGCTDTTVDVYMLNPTSITQDKRASIPMKESCADSGADDNSMEIDARAAQIAGAQANWDAYFRDHPELKPQKDEDAADGPKPQTNQQP